jgi:hypothetical protein
MRRTLGIAWIALVGAGWAGCEQSEYAELKDAPAAELEQARALWTEYLQLLGQKETDQRPELLARLFARPLVARTEPQAFADKMDAARRKNRAGLLGAAEIVGLKLAADGPVLVLDSKAGEAGLPLAREDEQFRFADLDAASGLWTRKPAHAPGAMPDEPSLLYIRMLLADERAPVAQRLRAAVGLAQGKYRQEIMRAKQRVTDPIVRLGLGLARIKIDGSDEGFVKEFPTKAEGLLALRAADQAIFEEMLVKLTNMGAMVVDPPVNETLYRAAAGAPAALRARLGRALYDMAEASPERFANAVFNRSRGAAADAPDPALEAYFAEVARRSGKAPKVLSFLRKFARIGEGPERELCRRLLAQFTAQR